MKYSLSRPRIFRDRRQANAADAEQAMLQDTKNEKTKVNTKRGVVLKQRNTEVLILIKRETKSAALEKVSEMKMLFT